MRLNNDYGFRFFLVCFLINASAITVKAQGFVWAQSFSGSGSSVTGMAFDAADNVYVTGSFSGTIDFDQGPGVFNMTAVGNSNGFLVKEDAAGNFLWAKGFIGLSSGISQGTSGLRCQVDQLGNIYIAGTFKDSSDFDPGPAVFKLSSKSVFHTFILKLDAAGNFLWAKHFGGAPLSTDHSLLQDFKRDELTGNLYLSCNMAGTMDVDPGPGIFMMTSGHPTAADILIEKLDSAGNFVWAKQITGTDTKAAYIALDSLSNIYLGGLFNGTADFDPGPGILNFTTGSSGPLAPHDIFVEKLDSAGNLQWAKQIVGAGHDQGLGVAVDKFGNVLVTGYFGGLTDFDPGPGTFNLTSTSTRSIFTMRLKNNGTFSWARMAGAPAGLYQGAGVATDSEGSVYTAGWLPGGCDMDPGAGVYYVQGGVSVQKLDSAGNFIWARAWGANRPMWMGLDNANSIYVAGLFGGPVDFDPGPGVFTLTGSNAGFVEKLCGSSLTLTTTNDGVICSGASAQLSTPAIPGATYVWTKDGATIPGSSNTISVTQAGAYEVFVDGNCPSASAPVYISVMPTTQPTISITGPLGELVGQPVTITANVANAGPTYTIDWKNNGVSFATTTVPSVTYTKQALSDTITAFITSTSPGCYDSTLSNAHRVYDATGISETMKAAGIEVYPNPFEDVLTVKGLKVKDRLNLIDITGRVVHTWQATQSTQVFTMDDLSSGHYVLKIMNEKGEVKVNVPMVKK